MHTWLSVIIYSSTLSELTIHIVLKTSGQAGWNKPLFKMSSGIASKTYSCYISKYPVTYLSLRVPNESALLYITTVNKFTQPQAKINTRIHTRTRYEIIIITQHPITAFLTRMARDRSVTSHRWATPLPSRISFFAQTLCSCIRVYHAGLSYHIN
jgi:hypothetical protein